MGDGMRCRPWRTAHVTTIDMTAWCFLRSWFATLRAHGHDVHLLTTAGPFTPRLAEQGVCVHDVFISRRIEPWRDLISLWRLWRSFRNIRPDIVHTHTSKAGFLGRLAARLARVPIVLHTMHEPPHNAAGGPLTRRLYIVLERLAARLADRVITVSYANEREIERQRLVPRGRLSVIREGLDLGCYPTAGDARAAVRALGIPDGALVVGTVGRLEAAKGHTYLLQAMPLVLEAVPAARFVVVGSGHLLDDLQAQASSLGVADRVIFTGYREDMLQILQGFDLFVLPSLWEGLGMVLLEAMAYGKAIVASGVGGVNDVVLEGRSGLLVPPHDAEALARAMVSLLKDEARRANMGATGHERLLRDFRDDVCNERLMALYRRLLEGLPEGEGASGPR